MGDTSADNTKGGCNSSGLPALGLMLAIGMVVSAYVASRTIERVKLDNGLISVKGYAEKRITSDLASWTGRFQARDVALVPAYDIMSTDLQMVISYLEKGGVKRESIGVSSIDTSIKYKKTDEGQDTNELEGYELSQTVEISSTDVALITKVAAESTSLMKQGVEFYSLKPEYFYTKLDDLKVEMLGQAARDARTRAEQLVAGSGRSVGVLRSAEQGIFQITPPNSTETSGGGVNDTSSIDKVIKAVVAIQYALK